MTSSASASSSRPVHLRPAALLLVAVGGALGTLAREGLVLALPSVDGVQAGVLAANLAGALILGLLLEALGRRGPDEAGRRALRLAAGTGFCGGFTTYSALASACAVLLADGAAGAALLYAAATVLLGSAATWAGVLLGARTARSRA